MPVRLTYSAAVAVAAFLAFLSAFLPWASLHIPLLPSITRYGYEGDGIIVLLLGLLAAAVAAYLWLDRSATAYRLSTLFNAFLGGVIFATALVNALDSERAAGAVQEELGVSDNILGIDLGQLVQSEPGVYVAIVAGVMLALASVLAFAAQRLEPFASLLAAAACARCRADLPDGAAFCPTCGQRAGSGS